MGDHADSPLSEFEEKCCQEVDRDNDVESRLQSATADVEERVWIAFQEAARAVTNLCRESESACHATTEAARLCGHQQRNKEVLEWACTKRRFIRREDLIAMLAGRATPDHSSLTMACQNSGLSHHLNSPHSNPHLLSRPPVSCPSGVSCGSTTSAASPHIPPFVNSLPPRSDEVSLASWRRNGSGAVDDSQLWETFRLSARKRPSSGDNLTGSPKRGRFV